MYQTIPGLTSRALVLEGFGLINLISELNESVIAFPILFLMIGITYCFYGKKLFDIINFLIGGFIGLSFIIRLSPPPEIALFVFSIVAFVVGGLIGFFVPYLMVGIVGFTLGLGLFFGFSPVLGLIAGLIVGIVAVGLFRFFLPGMTALIGGSIIGSSVYVLYGSDIISILVGVSFFVAGAVFQYLVLESEDEGETRVT